MRGRRTQRSDVEGLNVEQDLTRDQAAMQVFFFEAEIDDLEASLGSIQKDKKATFSSSAPLVETCGCLSSTMISSFGEDAVAHCRGSSRSVVIT